jgi:hypothetical protein
MQRQMKTPVFMSCLTTEGLTTDGPTVFFPSNT